MRNRRLRWILPRLAVFALLSFVIVSCASFESTAYKSLYTMKQGYDMAGQSAGELARQGILTGNALETVTNYLKRFRTVYLYAVDALIDYHNAQLASDKEKYQSIINDSISRLADILAEIRKAVSP